MKPFCTLVAAMPLAAFLITGCGASSPDRVAIDWANAIDTGNKAIIEELAENKDMAELTVGLLIRPDGTFDKHEGATYKVNSSKINGDTATIELTTIGHGLITEDGEKFPIFLRKVGGKWKVTIEE